MPPEHSSLLTTPEAVTPRPRGPQWFYVGMALGALIITGVGFAPTFYFRRATLPSLSPLVVTHALVFSAWVLIFVLQTTLVASGHTPWHRRFGLLGSTLALLIVVFGPLIALPAARRGNLPGDPLAFLLVILVDILLFASCVGAAIYFRDRPATHKRLMVLGMASLLPPAISRWPIAAGHPPVIAAILLAYLAALPIHDWVTDRRVHPIALWGTLAVVLSLPIRFAVSQTAVWHRVAQWLVGRAP